MTFDKWLAREGRGAMTRVHLETHVSYPTLQKAKRGEALSRPLALAISGATGGEVTAETLELGASEAA